MRENGESRENGGYGYEETSEKSYFMYAAGAENTGIVQGQGRKKQRARRRVHRECEPRSRYGDGRHRAVKIFLSHGQRERLFRRQPACERI